MGGWFGMMWLLSIAGDKRESSPVVSLLLGCVVVGLSILGFA